MEISPESHPLLEQVRLLPEEPGVYLFKDERGKVLYVGKAKSLRDRVRSYCSATADGTPKTRALMARAKGLDWIAARTEVEALVLECNLIKEYRPRYNVRLRDDKKYPYIRITTDTFPRVFATRLLVQDGSEYFGPYSDVGAMRRTLALLQRALPTRPCTPPELDGIDRPCLYHELRMCGAPCVGLQTRAEYAEAVEGVRLFLRGRTGELVTRLRQRMQERSDGRDYESAARLRDQIQAIERSTDRMRRVVGEGIDRDAVALRRDGSEACGVVLRVRGGRLLASETFYFSGREEDEAEIFQAFFTQYYNATTSVPEEILTAVAPQDAELLATWLAEKRDGAVRILQPQRGEKRTLVHLASKNAALKLDEWMVAHGGAQRRAPDGVVQLGQALGMRDRPHRIECFDISNFQSGQPVASMVHFEAGEPVKALYRHFRIRGLAAPNDFAMMEQVVERHYARAVQDGRPLPDLVLVDGGRGQLSSAVRAVERLGLAGKVAIAGLAKQHEELFLPGRELPVVLPRTAPALKLVQRVRNEAHRFAIGYHRRLRSRDLVRSALDDIPGVGAKTRAALLRRFGSIAGVAAAQPGELAAVPGVGVVSAERILAVLSHPALRPDESTTAAPDPEGAAAMLADTMDVEITAAVAERGAAWTHSDERGKDSSST